MRPSNDLKPTLHDLISEVTILLTLRKDATPSHFMRILPVLAIAGSQSRGFSISPIERVCPYYLQE